MQILSFIFFTFCFLALNGIANGQTYSQNDTASKVIFCETTLFYPESAREKNISGTVIVAFDIDSNCRINNIRIVKGIGYGCDEEALKTLAKCKPRFIGPRKKCLPKFDLQQPFTFKGDEEE